jgi:hypothetical protein
MGWPCIHIRSIRQGDWEEREGGGKIRQPYYTLPDGREVRFSDLPVGAMWDSKIDPNYFGKRGGPCVVLPGRMIWRMGEEGTNGHLWTLSGDIPNVTASPSINFVGTYHGWVQNGVVSDDCEGRKFDVNGKAL